MSGGLALDEIAARLKTAADCELAGMNALELFSAKGASPALILTVAEVRRQGAALGQAHRIVLALARRPDLALQLLGEGA